MFNSNQSELTIAREASGCRWQSLMQLVSLAVVTQLVAEVVNVQHGVEENERIYPEGGVKDVTEEYHGDVAPRRGQPQRADEAHVETILDEVVNRDTSGSSEQSVSTDDQKDPGTTEEAGE